jgi:type VI secretion system secreted protein VgrG
VGQEPERHPILRVRIGQGEQDKEFTHYRAEIVPSLFLLTRKAQSRIFQRLTVPDILKKVLVGFDVKYDIQGTFHPRDFCVQYRETDFNFASRLMEEEGIYYFFEHADGKHTMVVANTPAGHSDVPVQSTVIHESVTGGERPELRITAWQKVQEMRSGKYTLWDHSFELPHKHLEAEKVIQDSVSVGSVSHKLKVGGNEKLEIYDFPGEYAQRFDGVDKGGGDQPAELEKIFTDNQRTTAMRIEQEALESLQIEGQSTCRQFTSGQKFTLQRHFNADGAYVLTSVQHVFTVSSADFRSATGVVSSYDNVFTCIPAALPFRPPRATPKPVVQGTQSAVVVGPAGEEIFPDKYSRVKVQFISCPGTRPRAASRAGAASAGTRPTSTRSGSKTRRGGSSSSFTPNETRTSRSRPTRRTGSATTAPRPSITMRRRTSRTTGPRPWTATRSSRSTRTGPRP